MTAGRRSESTRLLALVAVALVISGCGRSDPRNFGVVREGVLYRSGQLAPQAFTDVIAHHRIKTVVTLRPARGDVPNSDVHEEDICRSRGIKYIRIPPPTAWSERGPMEPVVMAFLVVMDDPQNHPVLVHCTAGRDRTGTACAAYRIEFDGWSPERGLEEMGRYGFDPDHDDAARAYARFVSTYRRRGEQK